MDHAVGGTDVTSSIMLEISAISALMSIDYSDIKKRRDKIAELAAVHICLILHDELLMRRVRNNVRFLSVRYPEDHQLSRNRR